LRAIPALHHVTCKKLLLIRVPAQCNGCAFRPQVFLLQCWENYRQVPPDSPGTAVSQEVPMPLIVLIAFLAGLVTVASPCILPILPIALSATMAQGRARPLGVILGLVVSFSVFTLAVSQLVALLGLSANTLRIAAVGIIALLGLSMIVPALNSRLEGVFGGLPGLAPKRQRSGLFGGLLTGAALGLVWAPCAGPILAAITTLAATRQVGLDIIAITAAYALGVGIPLLVIAYGGRAALRRIPGMARHTADIQKAFGVLMVLTAILIAGNADVALTAWATGALPSGWNDRLQAFEDTPVVRAQVDQLLGRSPAQLTGADLEAAVPPQAGSDPVDQMPGQATLPAVESVAAPTQAQPSPTAAPPLVVDVPSATATTAPTTAPPEPSPTVTPDATPSATGGPLPTQTPVEDPRQAAPSPTALLPSVPPPAPVAASIHPAANLPDGGPAPDFTGIGNWINSPALHLADLRGKVILVDFWTYSCINCIRTLPYVTSWYQKYHDQGFVVVGVHTPEFAFEHETPNVIDATKRFGITYPVAQDNSYATWNAYSNRYWPAEYFIDAHGHLRHVHFGEGNYDESEQVIQELLDEAGASVAQAAKTGNVPVPISDTQTPETYVGLDRQGKFASPEAAAPGPAHSYSIPHQLPLHSFAAGGNWAFADQYATEEAAGDSLRLHFNAKDVYVVLASDKPATVEVSVTAPNASNQSEDLDTGSRLHVSAPRLYHLARLPQVEEGVVDLHFDRPGVRAYAFTFGS
jgi:cytochrome c biogenesis protein CcdA/thiol-disulfide isomerase/thioredoxin